MRNVVLFIATSLDGYIARENGDIDWLFTEGDYGYNDFIKTVDAVIMGGKTYRQVMSFDGDYPYENIDSYIITHDASYQGSENLHFIHHDVVDFFEKLKKTEGETIWLVGGAEINSLFLENNLIDEIWLFQHPVFLGSGTPIFKEQSADSWFKPTDVEEFDTGMIKLVLKKS